jgi:hypothetical protein
LAAFFYSQASPSNPCVCQPLAKGRIGPSSTIAGRLSKAPVVLQALWVTSYDKGDSAKAKGITAHRQRGHAGCEPNAR